ncbi:alpha/beta fold hydrolase [Aurantimonas endophytica]|uniref:Pimeloyl-ACP methyl ester carboxylesterase n=1 Tax=Aurantimonas endophytica TaxID=1522175 RepID=A0A7W6MPP2_9HYPH|nr:alpha/beta fold hydrolase [Aurantimonas endophytica]MBB4003092.1 pimeloyl-ACP methyl ester carboxylesterase [Aurantimonas endophytica]MCO6403964.1 alpha/beta fold hydrolase [Aurantimonas endophytica]
MIDDEHDDPIKRGNPAPRLSTRAGPRPAAFDVSTADGASLKAGRSGAGPTVVLVSGLGGTAGFWTPVVAGLSQAYEVISFDQRGIGASSRGSATTTIGQLADDVLAVLDAADIESAMIVGHSTGGCIAQTLAAKAPDRVRKLCLSATWLRPSRYMTALFETRLRLLEQDPVAYTATATLISFAPAWLEENWSAYERAVAKAPRTEAERTVVAERIAALLAFDGSGSLPAISMPVSIIGAEDDMIVPAFLQRALAEALPAATLTLLPQGGHFFPVSRTEAFLAHLAGWAGEPQ